MKIMDKILQNLRKESHQILIFSQMTSMLDIIEDYCNVRGFTVNYKKKYNIFK